MSGLLVVVEGMMGAGKSSLVADLARRLGGNTLALLEPDSSDGCNPYLDDCNRDPSRWALTMQLHLIGLRRKMQLEAQNHVERRGTAILDRSVWGDACFAEAHASVGTMSANEYGTYNALFDIVTADLVRPDVVLWLDVPQDEIIRRIERRAGSRVDRASERALRDDYLRELRKNMDGLRLCYEDGGKLVPLAWGEVELGSQERERALDDAVKTLRERADFAGKVLS